MGYYCTVPQCTSLAGKTKNVKFHRFPRDATMANNWNIILKRGKPYTKYSKVCSLHFTQADYNVTTMGKNKGQWKTLNKDAVPSQNLPKLNPDGTVMVIRKSRTVKTNINGLYKEIKKENVSDTERWSTQVPQVPHQNQTPLPVATVPDVRTHPSEPGSILAFRLQGLKGLPSSIPNNPHPEKPKKQDAIMQTDPVTDDENPINFDADKFEVYPNDYMKTNEDYNSEAEKYALERKSFEKNVEFEKCFEKSVEYKTNLEYQKREEVFESESDKSEIPKSNGFEKRCDMDDQKGYEKMDYQKNVYHKEYENDYYYQDSVEMLRNQQQNLQLLQEQHRVNENQNFFDENHIKQEIEIDFSEEESFAFKQSKERNEQAMMVDQQRLMEQSRLMEDMSQSVKQEPETANNNGHEILQPQGSPYYNTSAVDNTTEAGFYGRPGPELLIAKQNALAAHTQLWQNTMKRPFFYSENNHYAPPQLLHRYEDITRILQ